MTLRADGVNMATEDHTIRRRVGGSNVSAAIDTGNEEAQ